MDQRVCLPARVYGRGVGMIELSRREPNDGWFGSKPACCLTTTYHQAGWPQISLSLT